MSRKFSSFFFLDLKSDRMGTNHPCLSCFPDFADMNNQAKLNYFYQEIPLIWNAEAALKPSENLLFLEPPMELQETQASFYVLLELPGLACQAIAIHLADQNLNVRGFRKPEFHIPARAVLKSELYYGAFERKILIPDSIQPEGSHAEYRNGVLVICLMKANA